MGIYLKIQTLKLLIFMASEGFLVWGPEFVILNKIFIF